MHSLARMDQPAQPQSPASFVKQLIPPRIARMAVHVVVLGLCLMWLVSLSTPGGIVVLMLITLPLAALAMFGWFVWTIHCLANRERTWWLAVIPALAATTVALTMIDAPLKLRFAASEGALNDAVSAVRASGTSASDARGRIGFFSIASVASLPGGGLAFYEAKGSFLADAGFAYLPTPPSTNYDGGLYGGHFQHLRGHWYTFTSGWND